MSKAKEFAYSKYPEYKKGVLYDLARNSIIQGYHKAEKDSELSWEDVKEIHCIALNLRDYVGSSMFGQPFYEEVLKRFNDYKEGKGRTKYESTKEDISHNNLS